MQRSGCCRAAWWSASGPRPLRNAGQLVCATPAVLVQLRDCWPLTGWAFAPKTACWSSSLIIINCKDVHCVVHVCTRRSCWALTGWTWSRASPRSCWRTRSSWRSTRSGGTRCGEGGGKYQQLLFYVCCGGEGKEGREGGGGGESGEHPEWRDKVGGGRRGPGGRQWQGSGAGEHQSQVAGTAELVDLVDQ